MEHDGQRRWGRRWVDLDKNRAIRLTVVCTVQIGRTEEGGGTVLEWAGTGLTRRTSSGPGRAATVTAGPPSDPPPAVTHNTHTPPQCLGPGVKTKVEPVGGARRQPERRRGQRQLPAYRAPNPSASLAGCRKKNLAESETERRALPIRRSCCAHCVTCDKYPPTVSSSSSLGGCV
jgi:hypothetical protein